LPKIRVIAVGKDKDRWVTDGCAHYEKLLSRFVTVQWVLVSPLKAASSLTPAQIKKREAERILKRFEKGIHVALADAGEPADSPTLARRLQGWLIQGRGIVSFLIGGPYGLDDPVLQRADHVLSLSFLTFPHQLVRLVLLEQLYRALSIMHGTDYHK